MFYSAAQILLTLPMKGAEVIAAAYLEAKFVFQAL
jgi:hypothetical protein